MRHIAVLDDDKIPRETPNSNLRNARMLSRRNGSKSSTPTSLPTHPSTLFNVLAPLSSALGMKGDDMTVTQGTAAINLNGKLAGDAPTSGDPAPAVLVYDVPTTDAA
ncbi:hypothetical protein AGABI2DRAFT_120964 [Agaricus bisporus var. bisporus H97]|uniref:hypothetical protein n=1 Tax=Agaricus bisporus var. bisporus (strain H97 / ATCC MYA-4626 / FGSC 10389) TaxID=936046 RepID=UPI00029F6FED|nr:hypothetical protein AGABI2DRAFT_120964 [Agaricus bisporus var. bisporus H97]EKV44867.1 hypothetical protein AGABI2DRAFT_120964 [Agaricus bisporus var. bisporus H97]